MSPRQRIQATIATLEKNLAFFEASEKPPTHSIAVTANRLEDLRGRLRDMGKGKK